MTDRSIPLDETRSQRSKRLAKYPTFEEAPPGYSGPYRPDNYDEFLKALKSGKKGERYRELLQVPTDIAASDKDCASDPRLLLKRRDAIARAIEELSR